MTLPDAIQDIIDAYNTLIGKMHAKAISSTNGRAYGGIVRAGKGKLVENIGKVLVQLAWEDLHQSSNILELVGKQIRIPIDRGYVARLKDPYLRDFITRNIKNYYYRYRPDILVSVNHNPVTEIECKAYTENAMLKRILVDATLLKSQYPDMRFLLLQLESQLGGDFSQLKDATLGSRSTHTLLSYFDIDLHIITLLEGERKVDRPIHKPEFFKPLKRESLERAVTAISEVIEEADSQLGFLVK